MLDYSSERSVAPSGRYLPGAGNRQINPQRNKKMLCDTSHIENTLLFIYAQLYTGPEIIWLIVSDRKSILITSLTFAKQDEYLPIFASDVLRFF